MRRRLPQLIQAALGLLLACSVACSSGEGAPDGAAPDAGTPDGPAAAPGSDPPRLIVLISIDTLRPDHLGVYGYERFTSPVLDQIAAEGVVFEDASAAAPWTLPSHASILTGRFPLRHGVITARQALPDDVPTLASMIASGGYDTAAVVNVEWLKRDDFHLTRDFARYQWVKSALARRAPSTFVTDRAIEWLEELGEGRLFLFMHYYDPHSDYTSEPAYERLFVRPYDGPADGTTWQLKLASLEPGYVEFCREHFDPDTCTFGGGYWAQVVDESSKRPEFDEADIAHLEDLYDAGVRQMDAELGRFFAALRRTGLLDQTLLFVTSDHGEEFMEHGRVDHFLTTYQESLRVPLIVRGPGVPRGVRVSEPVSSVDIAATILARAGVTPPEPIDGLDLSTLWSGGSTEAFANRFLYGEAAGGHTYEDFAKGFFPLFRSVRRGNFKLVYHSRPESYVLYDLAEDPAETTDVSARHPEVALALRGEMERRYAGFTPKPPSGGGVQLDPEDAARLRALGYVP